ncbi:MAG: hypothetical protein ACYC6W_05740 [Nitrosotalea sp.]
MIVDPSSGSALYPSPGHAFHMGGFGAGHEGMKGGFKHGRQGWSKPAPSTNTTPSGTQ